MNPSATSGALMIAGAIGLVLLWKSGALDGTIASATSIIKAGPNVPRKGGYKGDTTGIGHGH